MASRDASDSPPSFNLNGDSDQFATKKTDVFGSLGALEKSYQSKLAGRSEGDNKRDSSARDDTDPTEDEDNGRAFKRPRSPGQPQRSTAAGRNDFRSRAWTRRGESRGNRKPDFEANPSKWKKYSLEDTAVCGNTQNSRVAFDVIRSLRERREQDGTPERADLDQKMVFSKPGAMPESEEEKTRTSGDVHKMEEYQFGTKVARKRIRPVGAQRDSVPVHGTGTPSVSLSFEETKGEDCESISSDVPKQSDGSPGTGEQSDFPVEEGDDSGTHQEDGTAAGGQDVSVGFKKKRKGQRNIRNRQSEDD